MVDSPSQQQLNAIATPFTGWLVRVGDASTFKVFGDDYSWCFPVQLIPDGSAVEVVGVSTKPITRAVRDRAMLEVNKELGLKVQWDRRGDNPRALVQIEGAKGKINMKTIRDKSQRHPGRKMAHTDEAKLAGGGLDPAALKAGAADAVASFEAGEYRALNHGVIDLEMNNLEIYWLLRQKKS